jgi:hypothetical protein
MQLYRPELSGRRAFALIIAATQSLKKTRRPWHAVCAGDTCETRPIAGRQDSQNTRGIAMIASVEAVGKRARLATLAGGHGRRAALPCGGGANYNKVAKKCGGT